MKATMRTFPLTLFWLALGPGCQSKSADVGTPQWTEVGTDDTGGPGDDGGADGGATDSGNADDTAAPLVSLPSDPLCDELNPLYCLLPWPSDRYVEADKTTATGWRLAYDSEAIPTNGEGDPVDLEAYQFLDGMSPASQILTMFPVPPDLTDVADQHSIALSLEDDHPTILLDMTTGERLAHWVELDARADSFDETVVYLRITKVLEVGHDYAVAMRGLVDIEGNPAAVSDAFAALRDGDKTDSEQIEGRRGRYEEVFAALEKSGVKRAELQQAWWFPTASGDAVWRDLKVMREDAIERLGTDGIGCTVEDVEEEYGEDGDHTSHLRLTGTYSVPSYMDSPEPPARIVRDGDGWPVYVEDVEVDFTVIVPKALVEDGATSGPLVTFGHGLLGDGRSTISTTSFRSNLEDTPAVVVATDWAGMSVYDLGTVASVLLNISNFPYMTDRLQQGMVNHIALTRTFLGVCNDLEELNVDGVDLIDTSQSYYVGGSQGGIYGTTYLTIAPDIDRGMVFVNGAQFPFMMERSIDYVQYLPYFKSAYSNRVDQAVVLSLAQHLWDATDPVSYVPHITEGLDDISAKTVLSIAAHNDAQVPNLSTDLAMRTAGVPIISGSSREPYGFEVVEAPKEGLEGSAYITFDLGDRDVPEGNVAPEHDDGGHSDVGNEDVVKEVTRAFLQPDGRIVMPCQDICDPD